MWKLKHRIKMNFQEASYKYHMIVLFERNLYNDRKLRDIDPFPNITQEKLLLECISCIHLDACWSQTRLTVQQNTEQVLSSIKKSKLLSLEKSFKHSDPYPCRDHYEYEVASNLHLYSCKQWKHAESHNQVENIRKLKTVN